MNLGRTIRMCRTQRGLSQAELADRADCSVSYLSVLENNKRDPTLSMLTKIANALNMPIGLLFFLASEKDELQGIDKEFAGELARTALELLNEPIGPQRTTL
jgi:transcriptional regulator with XRE-family HTH domain